MQRILYVYNIIKNMTKHTLNLNKYFRHADKIKLKTKHSLKKNYKMKINI